jgi:octaprenyl-diphosphate synthase
MQRLLEFIHTATLLHDDVVDICRGQEGVHPLSTPCGETRQASLVGVFLYSIILESCLRTETARLSRRALSGGTQTILSEGEILELLKTSDPSTTEEEYFDIII